VVVQLRRRVVRMSEVGVDSAVDVCVDVCLDKPIRVLHVDDDAGFLGVAKECLEAEGSLRVDTALSAEEGLERLRGVDYDVVVSDYQMSGLNGLEFLRELRRLGKDVPFILFTCKGKAEIVVEALNSGVYRYVEKEGDAEVTYGELRHSICEAVRGWRAERRLREAEGRLRLITENMQDMLLLVDADLVCTYASDSHRWILGFEPGEMAGKCVYDFVHPGDVGRAVEKAFAGGSDGERMVVRVRCADGGYRVCEVFGKVLKGGNDGVVGGVFSSRDVSESVRLSERVGFKSRLLDSLGQAVVAVDGEGKVMYWNRAAERLYGWSEAEVLGHSMVDLVVVEPRRAEACEVFERVFAGEVWSGEFYVRRSDGEVFPAILTGSPIFGEDGGVVGAVGVSTDISEQKWMLGVFDEAVAKVTELNEKLHVVESLTRHDLRNKLAALNGRAFLLKKRCAGDAGALAQLGEIELVSRQMLRIMEFEKVYVQVGSEELKGVDVERCVGEAVLLFSDLRGARLVNECGGLTVMADSLLRQMFYNLVDNTLKYGEKVSVIRVFFREEGDVLRLVYEDDGVGVADDVRVNLFREGFGKGTGYGLYLIKRICAAYGWTIQENGKQGEGVRFMMTIPKKGKDGKKLYEITKR
jgi:PAS domain S-box-containing protein